MAILVSSFILIALSQSARFLSQVEDILGTSTSLSLHSFLLSTSGQKLEGVISPGFDSWFDDCLFVYLDVGSNTGIQIRKVYEPELYPNDPAIQVYDRLFRRNRTADNNLCVVGFEANPHHTETLQRLEKAYQKKGWRVAILTETAVDIEEGTTEFFFDKEAKPQNKEWGASTIPWQKSMKQPEAATVVRKLDLAKYVLDHVATRRLVPERYDTRKHLPLNVLMKMDIEGSEHKVLPHMILTGALCTIGTIFYERHRMGEITSGNVRDTDFIRFFQTFIKDYNSSCPTTFLSINNEVYGTTDFPLPV